MTTSQDKTKEFLSKAERYLMQQQQLFGDTLFPDYEQPDNSSEEDIEMAKRKRQDVKTTQGEVQLAASPYPDEPWVKSSSLKQLDKEIHNCLKCPLGHTRTKFVFGTGNPDTDVMFIGEAPGADEDAQGEPFVGRAGQLLNKIIEATGFKREEVYICNIIKCRPPNNRAPLPMEIETCTPYLLKQIELIKPKFIISLGRTAAQWLLQTKESLGALRGKLHDYNGISIIVTYHPAALLRNPDWKRPTWEDMKMFKKQYEKQKST